MRIRNKTILLLAILVGSICFTSIQPCPALAQEKISSMVLEPANKALSNYVQEFLTEKNVARYGFKSLEEARTARLGEPLKVMFIGLENLKGYSQGMPAASLLIDKKTLWFPVVVGQETRAKLEIIEKDGIIIPGAFGAIKTTEKIDSTRRILTRLIKSGNIRDVKTTALVEVPSISAEFLYVEGADGEFFMPAMMNPERLGLEEGKLYAAEDLLSKLHDFAKEIDPNKVM
jgi:hypothetical protein